MLKDRAVHYYYDQNRNCAEALLLAANDEYALGLSEKEIRLMGAFGGGMGCGGVCGALSGAVAALGAIKISTTAQDTPNLKEETARLVEEFEKKLGSQLCSELTPKYKTETGRCSKTVEIAAQVLEEYLTKLNNPSQAEQTVTAEQIKQVKARGFLHCKGTDEFNGRIITRNGKLTAAEAGCIAEAAEKFGGGELAFTSRLTVEVQRIPYRNIEDFCAYVEKCGLYTGGTGSKVRPVVACKATTCQYGLLDSFGLSEKIHHRFFEGYSDVKLPHKFKIAVGGCPNNCVKPDLNDLGIVGQKVPRLSSDQCRSCKKCQVVEACPIHTSSLKDGKPDFGADCNHCGRCIPACPFGATDAERVGYRVYIGGRWGKKIAQGQPLGPVFETEEEVLSIVEKAILLFRDQGITGERFADTIARIGFAQVERQLLSDELLQRKEEILGAQKHLVGGATC